MPIIAVECVHCGAKLKIKSGTARTPAAVKCPKCGKQIALGKKPDAVPAPPAPETQPPPEQVMTPPPLPAAEEGQTEESSPEVPVEEPAALPPEPPPPAAIVEPPPQAEPAVVPPPLPAIADPAPAPAPQAQPQTKLESIPPAMASRKAAAPIVVSHLGDHPTAAWVDVSCPSCNWQSKVREEVIGKKIRCKQCGAVIDVRGTAAPAPAAPVTGTAAQVADELPPIRIRTSSTAAAAVQGDAASQAQIAEIHRRLVAAEQKLAAAELRAAEAETAKLKLADAEKQVAELRRLVSEMAADFDAEINLIEKRRTVLEQQISLLNIV